MSKKVCCICEKEFHSFGNNPEPVMPIVNNNGERNYCCDWCNQFIVVPARVRMLEAIRYAKENSDPDFKANANKE